MNVQDWIFSIRYAPEGVRAFQRRAVVGPARTSTVEAELHLAAVPEETRAEIRADEIVGKFVEGLLDPEESGYYAPDPFAGASPWLVCIGSVQEVIRFRSDQPALAERYREIRESAFCKAGVVDLSQSQRTSPSSLLLCKSCVHHRAYHRLDDERSPSLAGESWFCAYPAHQDGSPCACQGFVE